MNSKFRTFELRVDAVEADSVSCSVSSEFPVEREGGFEVLSHDKNAIDLSRSPLPLIINHEHNRLNIGLINDLKIVNKRLKGKIKFGDRTEAKEILKDVKNGILRYLSVGYEVLKTKTTKTGYLVTNWKPFEVSIVSVPADHTVGINRSKNNKKRKVNMEYSLENIRTLSKRMQNASGSELFDLGEEFDDVASVVYAGEAPKFANVGVAGVQAWLGRSSGADKPDIDTRGGYYSDFNIENGKVNFNDRSVNPFSSLGEQLRAVIGAGHPDMQTDPRLYQVRAASGLNEGVNSDGGFLLQQSVSNNLLQNVWGNNDILKRITKYPLQDNSNSLAIPGFDESSRADGSRSGGVNSYWVTEGDEITASKPKFRTINLSLNKLVGLAYATDELIEDVSALEIYIERAFTDELEFRIQDSIINGSGVGMPLGIKNSSALVSVGKEAGQSADTIVYENILKMWSRLFSNSRKNAVWLINQNCEPQLHQMSLSIGTGGNAVYLPSQGIAGAPHSTLFGRPVIPIEQCSTLGDLGDIYLASFEDGYVSIDRGGAKMDSSIHVRFLYGENCLRFQYRFSGCPVLASAITPANGTDTLSHFITLNERA
jgi:HK97 family phage major capsid protein/HK97 family phage prohead protease